MRKSFAKSRLARSITSVLELLESRTFLSVAQPANPGFEAPSLGTGSFSDYQYNPSGASWTFTPQSGTNGSGISANGGGFTYSNAPAPEGTQVAFLQGTGTISQSVNFGAGTFAIGFDAAQRAAQWQTAQENFQVLVDGNVVGSFTPAGGGGYAAYETTGFTVSAGSHMVTFKGLDSAGGDNTALVDAVHVDSIVNGVPGDAGFESPNVGSGSFGSFQYNPPGTPWSFDSLSGLNGSGITGNGSGFTAQNPNAPEGVQVGFVQGTGHISQSVSLGAGSYAINFDAAQRVQWQNGNQTFDVLLDGNVIGTITPANGTYEAYQTSPFTATNGSHTLSFKGLNPQGGDHTAFIDDVKVVSLGTTTSPSTTLTVGPGQEYGTIQSAVNAAQPGDTIDVYSGTYTEQVTIPQGLNNLTLEAAPGQTVAIKAPSTMDSSGAIVHIAGAQNTILQGFTIEGPGATTGEVKFGVLVDDGGSATVQHNHVTDIEDSTFGASQTGYAVAVTDGSGNVLNNIIDNYQKGGVLIGLTQDVTGSPTWTQVGDVEGNFVTGVGGSDQITQNGIVFSGLGATGTAKMNHVTANNYTANTSEFGNAAGILLFGAGNSISVLNNIAYNNDTNIVVDGGTASVNTRGSNFALVSGNTVYNATVFDGIDLTDGVTSVTVSQNYSHNNATDGLYIDSNTSGNTISNNTLTNNGVFDIEDQTYSASNSSKAPTYGTLNFYSGNTFNTSNDPSIPSA
jgi:hypothetical protein